MTRDWREQGQEEYLRGLAFSKRRYERYRDTWDHDHCEFCWAKFCEGGSQGVEQCLAEGYATPDRYRWICEPCFRDFKDKYNLKILSPEVQSAPSPAGSTRRS
jgi:hypothetical protein